MAWLGHALGRDTAWSDMDNQEQRALQFPPAPGDWFGPVPSPFSS